MVDAFKDEHRVFIGLCHAVFKVVPCVVAEVLNAVKDKARVVTLQLLFLVGIGADEVHIDDTHRGQVFQEVGRLLQIDFGLQVAQGQRAGIQRRNLSETEHRFRLKVAHQTIQEPCLLAPWARGKAFSINQMAYSQHQVVVAVGAFVIEHLGHKLIHERRMNLVLALAQQHVFQPTSNHNLFILNFLQIKHRPSWLGLGAVSDDLRAEDEEAAFVPFRHLRKILIFHIISAVHRG